MKAFLIINLEPSRQVFTDPAIVEAMQAVLSVRGISFITGKTWTTDAPYRETPGMIQSRVEEGCLTVEMEASALLAVSQFRKVKRGSCCMLGMILSGENWDKRNWQSRKEIRESLFWLAADICLSL